MKLGFDRARHLLMRTGFAPRPRDIAAFAKLTPAQAVDRLLGGVRTTASVPAPAWVNDPIRPPNRRAMRGMAPNARRMARKKMRRKMRARGDQLKVWWYTELVTTPSPLTERLVMFWHGHFTSSMRKVRFPTLMYRQNLLLRQHAAGNFANMLYAIARDPAMIIYLDNRNNRKGKPNENFAREVLELFTLGEGRHYTERDIKEAARAFTGWFVNRKTGEYRFATRMHDFGAKEFMGKRGNFNGDDILSIVLRHPRVSEHIVERLWTEFISPTPHAAEVRRLAKIFRTARYELKPLLRALFTSPHFYAAGARHTLIKSPAHLIAGTVRWFQVEVEDPFDLVRAGRTLGQDLFDPPNVKGWPGGTRWITADTLLRRQQLLSRLFRDPGNVPELSRRGVRAFMGPVPSRNLPQDLTNVILGQASVYPLPPRAGGLAMLRHFVTDPTYQLT